MTALHFTKLDPALYAPGTDPGLVDVPTMRFIVVEGRGDPNTAPAYAAALECLYGLTYTIKMSPKSGDAPPGYVEYAVPPLEGLWWFDDEPFTPAAGVAGRKDDLVWAAMIRQPSFVTPEVFAWAQQRLAHRKKLDVSGAHLEDITEGRCAQVMHLGPYDDEPATVARLEAFIASQGLRTDMAGRRAHHEIYLGDPRRTAPAKLRTVIRHPVAQP